jgi:hypothetical protein
MPRKTVSLAGRAIAVRWLTLAGVALVVVGLSTSVLITQDDGRKRHSFNKGPLGTGVDDRTAFPVSLNSPLTYGQAIVHNRSKKTVVLEAVRVRPPLPDGIEIIEVTVVGPNRHTASVGTEEAYPSPYLKDVLRPLRGAKVPPETTKAGEAGVEIVFGLKVTKPGYYGFREFDLDYHIGSKEYTVRMRNGFIACAPKEEIKEGCVDIERRFEKLEREVGGY